MFFTRSSREDSEKSEEKMSPSLTPINCAVLHPNQVELIIGKLIYAVTFSFLIGKKIICGNFLKNFAIAILPTIINYVYEKHYFYAGNNYSCIQCKSLSIR